jgi:CMP-N,N'-diacetyllegionaminic acid synthase
VGHKMGVLAVVPARGGSKGILRKNLVKVQGRTLIDHACSIASVCPSVGRVVITSDDPEMGAEGLRSGAHYFVNRPENLSTDAAIGADAWVHAWLDAEREFEQRFDLSVLLQPTSPTRSVEDVEATVYRLVATGSTAALTVSPVPKHFSPAKVLWMDDSGQLAPVLADAVPNRRRQDVPAAYWLNGHCYAVRRDPFLRDQVVIPRGAQSVVIERRVANIDGPEDLRLAEVLLDPKLEGRSDPT